MEIFAVGGSVRDELLGLPIKDRDYVVVGSSPEEMTALGFKAVGKDFPVFLHPTTHEEYALARTERKTAKGYKGFQVYAAPDVSLEEDLARRDLTINAMARDANGQLIDPYHGAQDLQQGILRHVSPAFSEDPVRILRIARFAARFDFKVAAETLALMREMHARGEVDALVAERVWQELAKGLMEKIPSRMFETLRAADALQKILPEVDALFGVPQPEAHHPEIDTGVHVMMVVDFAARQNYALTVRFAALTHDLGKGTTPAAEWPKHIAHEARSVELVKSLCQRLRVPSDCRELALITARYHGEAHHALELRPQTLLKLLKGTDAIRQPQRFEQFLQACEADSRGRKGYEQREYVQARYLKDALNAALNISSAEIAAKEMDPAKIGAAVSAARLKEIKKWMKTKSQEY